MIFSATGYLAPTMTTLDGEETEQRLTILCCQSLVPAKKIGEERWAPLEENQQRFFCIPTTLGLLRCQKSMRFSRSCSVRVKDAHVRSGRAWKVMGKWCVLKFWNYVAKLTVLNRDNFGKFGFKRSCVLHVTSFPPLWTEGPT
jgi:hypothetical protein